MKIGICYGFNLGEQEVKVDLLEVLLEIGFDYMECSLASIVGLEEKDFERVEEYVRHAKLPVLASNGFFPGNIKLVGDAVDLEAVKAYTEKAATRAERLGIQKCVLGSSGSRNYLAGYDKHKADLQFREAVELIANILKEHGLTLILEHLNRTESNVVCTFEESAKMASEIPAMHSILDTYHFEIGNEPYESILEKAEQIGHIHLARCLGRVFPEYADMEEMKALFSVIKESGYKGTCSFECRLPNIEERREDMKLVVNYIKNYFNKENH